jgi:endo-1,4-beta-xylanase
MGLPRSSRAAGRPHNQQGGEMKIKQSIGVAVYLTLLYGACSCGYAQQAHPAAAASAQTLTYSPGPPPQEFVPDPQEHPTVVLWPDGAPGSEKYKGKSEVYRMARSSASYTDDILVISQVHSPSLTVFLPPKKIATGAAIIVAPGGGFKEVWITVEGYRVAAWLSQQGIAAFVLKYRLPQDTGSTYTMDDGLADMQRAIRTVKSRSAEWGIDPNRVGTMGFSAGSMLSGITGQRFDEQVNKPVDAIDQLSAKPAFEALIYGTPFTGTNGEKPQVEGVRKDTPPTFLLGGGDDPVSAKYPEVYQMLKDAGVPVELHLYEGIGHGFGFQPENSRSISQWPDRLYDWLFDSGFLTKAE